MKVTSYIWIGKKRVKLDELTQEEKQDCIYKLHMQTMKTMGECTPSPEWFAEHPEHKAYWDKLVVV